MATACSGGTDATNVSEQAATESVHLVEHARGATDVPVSPQRVVVLEPVHLDTSVALGVIPIGTTVLSEATGVPAYLGTEAASVETVGTVPEPNVEEIAALRPDLIIGTETRHSELYDRFAAIAPTVYMASQADPWQDNVRLVAKALNKSQEADALLDGYQERCEEIATKFGTEGKTAQLIRPRDGNLTLYGPTSFAGSTLECAGFRTPERDWEGSISIDLSPERVAEARADVVVVTTPNPADRTTVPSLLLSAFPSLHLVDMSYWITGVGPLGGLTVLDDIERILRDSQ
ncbi:periplasmic binding family protein [Rhodococcus sp. MTM3W5.2]|nr:periplasmic binding family protein [Rhodococcus sp. MTM3W5.2]